MAMIERMRGFDDDVKPVLIEAISAMEGPTLLLAFCQSAITRANGLYAGIVREIRDANHLNRPGFDGGSSASIAHATEARADAA